MKPKTLIYHRFGRFPFDGRRPPPREVIWEINYTIEECNCFSLDRVDSTSSHVDFMGLLCSTAILAPSYDLFHQVQLQIIHDNDLLQKLCNLTFEKVAYPTNIVRLLFDMDTEYYDMLLIKEIMKACQLSKR